MGSASGYHCGFHAPIEVPRGSRSLAHVLRPEDLAPRVPAGGLDVDPMRPSVAAIDRAGNSEARFRWLDRRHARVDARVERGDILSIQVTYHPGWHRVGASGATTSGCWPSTRSRFAHKPTQLRQ